jgi:hypothetical protein
LTAFETGCIEDLVFGAVNAGSAIIKRLSGGTLLAGVGLVLILVGDNIGNPKPVIQRVGFILDHITFHQHIIIRGTSGTSCAHFRIGVEELVFGTGDALFTIEIRHCLRTLLPSDFALLQLVFGQIFNNQICGIGESLDAFGDFAEVSGLVEEGFWRA